MLILATAKITESARQDKQAIGFKTFAHMTSGLWSLNVLIGASYIILAKLDEFPEWLSLAHLVVGVGSVLMAICASILMRFSKEISMKGKKKLNESGLSDKHDDSGTVVQSITVNIHDSVVQGDVITSAHSEKE
jgi:hypothetical protein